MAITNLERITDLNIFYREDWSEETGTTWASTFTIDPYIRESDAYGVRNYNAGVLIECNAFETQWLQEQFPEDEYGSDFWIFADEVQFPSRRIAKIVKSINYGNLPNDGAVLIYEDSSTM